MTYYECVPAYGRDYRSKKYLLRDYHDGKDFQIISVDPECGRYINKEQVKEGMTLNIRYDQLRKIAVIRG